MTINIGRITNRLIDSFLAILQLQLFMLLVALPILVAWGLPISPYSPLGNVLFVPFITIFLVVASIVFFLELLYIPNTLPIWGLEQITSWWIWCMQFGVQGWNIGFPKAMLPFILIIFVITIAITLHPRIKKSYHYIAIYSCLLLCCIGVKRLYYTTTSPSISIGFKNKSLTIVKNRNGLTIIDHEGLLGSNISVYSWIEYTLLSTLNKTFGTTAIEHLVTVKPGTVVFNSIAMLAKRVKIKHLYIMPWQGESPRELLKAYGRMMYALKEQNTVIHRLYQPTITFPCDAHLIVIEKTGNRSSFHDCTYDQTVAYSQPTKTL